MALFHQDLQDEINGFVFDPVTFLSTSENMSGKSTRSGAEVSLQFSASDSFGVNAHYTYTDSTEPDFAGKDSRELRSPRHSGGLGAALPPRRLDQPAGLLDRPALVEKDRRCMRRGYFEC